MDYNDLLIEIFNMTPEQRSQKVKVADSYCFGFNGSDCTDIHRLEDVPHTGPVLFTHTSDQAQHKIRSY